MPERAHVTSVEALENFRAALILYLSKARPTLDEVSSDVARFHAWLETEQRTRWENEVRRRTKALQQAQQAVFSARLATLRGSSDAELLAYHRAQRALEEAEEKLRRVKKWCREFDTQIEPLAKQLDHLRNLLALDMVKAAASLAQTIRTLSEYAGITAAPVADSEPRGSSGTAGAGETGAPSPQDLPAATAPAPVPATAPAADAAKGDSVP